MMFYLLENKEISGPGPDRAVVKIEAVALAGLKGFKVQLVFGDLRQYLVFWGVFYVVCHGYSFAC